ncbi:hypothetical protein [Rhizobium mongolense]|uniref:Uncharacterized protein n=1 Tax=Rhizobium mongolense TaxID=57676 RepID=A0A7W6RRD6_9HYPH|nr:hypothetical protein [Rhizobium mongolense]MBB4277254.1 hypothetical protein [Rhizobium mongolense]
MLADFDVDEFIRGLDGERLEQVVLALNIPQEKLGAAVSMLEQGIRESIETNLRQRLFDAAADRKALEKIATAAQNLISEIDVCSAGACHILERSWPEDAISPAQLLKALDTLATVAVSGKAGRPKSYGALGVLVSWLIGIADKYGGIASIKANTRSGRLVDALTLLHDVLPFKIVPAALPCGSIAKWKDENSRLRRRFTTKNRTKITRL